MAAEEILSSKRQRKSRKTEDGGHEGQGGSKARAPSATYLRRLCRVRAVGQEGEWEPFRILAYRGRDKQTTELGSAETEDEVAIRTIELRDHSLYAHIDVGWGPEPDADASTADDQETFVPLLLFTHAGRADPESRGRLLAFSPHSGKQPCRVRQTAGGAPVGHPRPSEPLFQRICLASVRGVSGSMTAVGSLTA